MLTRRRIHVVGASVLIFGQAYKDNCTGMRNTRAFDIVEERVSTPMPSPHGRTLPRPYMNAALHLSRRQQKDTMMQQLFRLFAHQQFVALGSAAIRKFGKPENVLYDIKYIFPKDSVDAQL